MAMRVPLEMGAFATQRCGTERDKPPRSEERAGSRGTPGRSIVAEQPHFKM